MSPPGARLTCAEAATVTAAPGEPPGAEAVVVVPLVLLHVALPVELRSRVSPVAVEHDPDAVELEARLPTTWQVVQLQVRKSRKFY